VNSATVYRFVYRNFTRWLPRYKVRGKRILSEVMRPSRISPVVIAAALSACAQEPEALNSERIEERFGSYGIEVLSHEAGVRRSSLYSVHDDIRTCRTYAVVRFVDESTPRVAQAHADVIAGQSIGSTFRSDGWQIGKVTLHVGSINMNHPEHTIGQLMRLEQPVELGVHAYQLVLERDDQTIDYATIVETHHPDYLSVDELEALYGSAIKSDPNAEDIQNLSTLIMDID
jgi:hypothetical protein